MWPKKILTFVTFAGASIALCLSGAAQPDRENEGAVIFTRYIWPLLNEKCLACHGNDPDKIKGGLNLRTREQAFAGGESGNPAVVAGQPEQSLLFTAVTWQDANLQMPPKENDRLTPSQVRQLHDWIRSGAEWPNAEERAQILSRNRESWQTGDGIRVKTSGGLSEEWNRRTYDPAALWPYQPLERPQPPRLPSGSMAAHPVDAFIHSKLRDLDLPPAPRADRRTLIRRATYDLTGLPPDPEDVKAFATDPAGHEQAFLKVIDRLLASPHYGEQYARHWLDVVRYADSSGFANDYERGNAWRYRDYVIRSFNQDKPFDQFIREQVAGDEWAAQLRAQGETPNPEWLIAAGFLRMGPWELTGMEVAKIARQRFLDDVTDAVGQVFLAHPLQCARCHDHKFDPIPTRDYYRMQAVFATTQIAEREVPFLAQENRRGFGESKILQLRKEHYQQILHRIHKKEEAAARQWCKEHGLEYISRQEGRKRGLSEDQIPPRHIGLSSKDLGMERIARKGLQRLAWEMERYEPYALSVYSGGTPQRSGVYRPVRMPENPLLDGEVETVAILSGGDPFSPLEPVKPGALSVVHSLASKESSIHEIRFPETIEGRRLALADWLAHPENPLPARVTVNRIWQWHFGKGIVASPNNFGAMGDPPTHPGLLDYLAATFIEKGCSIKDLHRLVMTSQTYCRRADHPDLELLEKKDPQRIHYAVFLPQRLRAEEIRDSMLAVSKRFDTTLGGIPVRPEINREAAMQPRQVMGTFAAPWQPSSKPEQRHRRSLYTLQLRGLSDPFMEVFNHPNSDISCERRDESNVTPQALSLLNSQLTYRHAAAAARNTLASVHSREEAVQSAFQHAYARPHSSEELRISLNHWKTMEQRHNRKVFPQPSYPSEITRQVVEENTGEKFSYVELLEFYRRFEPDPTFADLSPKERGLAELYLVLFNSNEFIYIY